jgi:hypothetical protein
MPVPYTFGTATTSIPLSNLDANFNTPVTIGSTTVGLGNTVTTVANLTLTNATISSGNVTVTTGVFGAGSNTAPSITTTGDTNTGIFFPAADTIAFTEGGAESIRINSSGNFLIGYTADQGSGKLQVNGAGRIGNFDFNTDDITYVGGGNFQIGTIFGTPMLFKTSNTERMRLDTNGNLGIGGLASGYGASRLAVVGGELGLSNTSDARFYLYTGTTVRGLLYADATRIQLEASGTIPLTLWTNSGERARIDSSGNLLIGTTSYTTFSGINNVAVQNPTGYSVASGGTGISYASERIAFNAGQFYVLNESSAGVVLTNGSTAWAAQSDERLKDIIEPIEDALNKVGSIRAVIGKYKSDKNGTRRSFLIAQDIQKVLPEAVEYCKLPTGNDETKYLSVRYTDMIPLLVASIKEQQTLIENLTTRLNALEGK